VPFTTAGDEYCIRPPVETFHRSVMERLGPVVSRWPAFARPAPYNGQSVEDGAIWLVIPCASADPVPAEPTGAATMTDTTMSAAASVPTAAAERRFIPAPPAAPRAACGRPFDQYLFAPCFWRGTIRRDPARELYLIDA
jgi:hypothetical protein